MHDWTFYRTALLLDLASPGAASMAPQCGKAPPAWNSADSGLPHSGQFAFACPASAPFWSRSGAEAKAATWGSLHPDAGCSIITLLTVDSAHMLCIWIHQLMGQAGLTASTLGCRRMYEGHAARQKSRQCQTTSLRKTLRTLLFTFA